MSVCMCVCMPVCVCVCTCVSVCTFIIDHMPLFELAVANFHHRFFHPADEPCGAQVAAAENPVCTRSPAV